MKKLHYSWVILVVTFISIIVAGIIRSSSGIFIDPFETEFGWGRPAISFAFAVGLFLYGFSGPFMAAFVDIFGLKKMMLYSMAILTVGLSLTFVMNSEWQLILIWGVMLGIGSGLFLTVLSTQVANRWFVKRRGLAVGFLTAATATGQLVLLPVLASFVENYSWRAAIALIFALSIAMFIIIAIFMKSWPKDVGTTPYGQDEHVLNEPPIISNRNPFKVAINSLIEGLKVKRVLVVSRKFLYLWIINERINWHTFHFLLCKFWYPISNGGILIIFNGGFRFNWNNCIRVVIRSF